MGHKFLIWFRAAFTRALRTVSQTALATIGTAAMLEEVDFHLVLSASLLAGLLSFLSSLSGLPEVDSSSSQSQPQQQFTPQSQPYMLSYNEDIHCNGCSCYIAGKCPSATNTSHQVISEDYSGSDDSYDCEGNKGD